MPRLLSFLEMECWLNPFPVECIWGVRSSAIDPGVLPLVSEFAGEALPLAQPRILRQERLSHRSWAAFTSVWIFWGSVIDLWGSATDTEALPLASEFSEAQSSISEARPLILRRFRQLASEFSEAQSLISEARPLILRCFRWRLNFLRLSHWSMRLGHWFWGASTGVWIFCGSICSWRSCILNRALFRLYTESGSVLLLKLEEDHQSTASNLLNGKAMVNNMRPLSSAIWTFNTTVGTLLYAPKTCDCALLNLHRVSVFVVYWRHTVSAVLSATLRDAIWLQRLEA